LNDEQGAFIFKNKIDGSGAGIKCPYGKVGDIIWVKETMIKNTNSNTFWPVVDGYKRSQDESGKFFDYEKTVSAMLMPKIACRLFLEITSIKVERLADISDEDCIKEGISKTGEFWIDYTGGLPFKKPWQSFASLWFYINGRDSWIKNPWVWVIEFKMVPKPQTFA
jgi:hypothetical protein